MDSVVEIGFKGFRREYYTNPQQFPFRSGDYVIVEADRGEDLGMVFQVGIQFNIDSRKNGIKKIIRKPSLQDTSKLKENRKLEQEAFDVCKDKISHHQLNMKLVDTEYQFDRNKLTFYFTADKRVDFRELVKDLAAVYRTRIELRQIGVRDEARRMGGYGPCGLQLCCTTIMHEFDTITTQIAKEQNLPLNPSKLSGVCGRLKCCLRYEIDFYQNALEQFPDVGQTIVTPTGKATVDRVDFIKEEVILKYSNTKYEQYSLDEMSNLLLSSKKNSKGTANPSKEETTSH
ncbi:MAG TPA: hypothetical protein ENH29_08210 [Bacteroidetes bacterium]|nr:hypothetical protein [Bacteroidota bacterium]